MNFCSLWIWLLSFDIHKNFNYYRPQWSWGKVIFSEACVKISVHRGVSQHALQGPGPHLGGSWGVWHGGSPGPHLGVGIPACTEADTPLPPQQTATARGGTHPTGMHSCVEMFQVRESMNSLDLSICSTSHIHNIEEPCYRLNYVNIQLTRSFLNVSVAA